MNSGFVIIVSLQLEFTNMYYFLSFYLNPCENIIIIDIHIFKLNKIYVLHLSNIFLPKVGLITYAICIRVMKVLKNLEYHHWHSLKSKLDYQWPTCPKRTGKEFEKQDLQSSKVFPSAQGKMGWNGQPFSGFHTSKNENAFKL